MAQSGIGVDDRSLAGRDHAVPEADIPEPVVSPGRERPWIVFRGNGPLPADQLPVSPADSRSGTTVTAEARRW
jgi:hypothetical protein